MKLPKARKKTKNLLSISLITFSILLFILQVMLHSKLLLKQVSIKESIKNHHENNIFKKKTTKPVEFSACMLVKDENDNLIEWIAYHYYMINLKNLIICVDPMSTTSPFNITKRWKDRINVTIWHEDVFNKYMRVGIEIIHFTKQKVISLHDIRQRNCYIHCLKHLKESLNKSWTILIDPDEFITFNPVANDDYSFVFEKISSTQDRFKVVFDKEKSSQHPQYKQHRISEERTISSETIELWKKRTSLPFYLADDMHDVSIASYLSLHEETEIPWRNKSCVVLPRLYYGSHQETNHQTLSHLFPTKLENYIAPSQFTTLSYFRHAPKWDTFLNKHGKCILNLEKVSNSSEFTVDSPHLITPSCGLSANTFHDTALLRVNHYTRSLEAFMSRMDIRRTIQMFQDRSALNHSQSMNTQGWLLGFIQKVGGVDHAIQLLKGVGEIHQYKHQAYDYIKNHSVEYNLKKT